MSILFRPLVIVIILIASSLNAADFLSVSDEQLYSIHSAIFNTFNPFSEQEMDTTTKHLLTHAKNTSFDKITSYPNIKNALYLLNNLHLLRSRIFLKLYYSFIAHDKEEVHIVSRETLQPIEDFIDSLAVQRVFLSITDLSAPEQLKLFALLVNSEINILRQIGMYVRMFYNQSLYEGSISEKISGHVDPGNVEASIVPTLPAFTTHMRYNSFQRRLDGHLDTIIIGSGAAGSVAAYELQKQGLQVLVVESGPMVIPGAIDTMSDLRFMESQAPRIVEDGSIALLNGEAVGGGTTVNLNMSFSPTMPIVRHRFHRWHDQGMIPDNLWTDDEIDKASDWVNSIFEPRTINYDEININNTNLMRGAFALDIPYKRYVLNTYKPGQSPHEVSDKKSSFEQLLLPSMTKKVSPTTLMSDCRVTRVLIKQGKAYGVECIYEPKVFGLGIVHDIYGFRIPPKTKIRIFADNIVLAAGNLGTSAVLLNSKINNPNIGRGFVVHPLLPLMGKFDHAINADQGEPSTIFIDHFMPTDENKDKPGYLLEVGLGKMSLWSLLVPGLPKQVKDNLATIDHAGGFSVLLSDTPNDKNHVEVDCYGRPKVHYKISDYDRSRMIDGIKTGIRLLFAAGAQEVSFSSFEKPLFQTSMLRSNTITPDMDLDQVMSTFKLIPNQTMMFGAHMMGGNKIGIDPRDSVVNGDYQVWGTKDLYVIDSSIFPESMGANPMQTIYTCAKIFTERFLKAKFNQKDQE
jgi:choline dehydrogenase-like flavoprotein